MKYFLVSYHISGYGDFDNECLVLADDEIEAYNRVKQQAQYFQSHGNFSAKVKNVSQYIPVIDLISKFETDEDFNTIASIAKSLKGRR